MRIFNILSNFFAVVNHFIGRDILEYDAVYFVGDNQAINRVRVKSSRTSNRGAFSGSFAALILSR